MDGTKRALGWYRGHLVVVCSTPGQGGSSSTRLQIYDLRAKHVAHSSTLRAPVSHLLCGPRSLTLLLADGGALVLEEISLERKLDEMYRRGLYGAALDLARVQESVFPWTPNPTTTLCNSPSPAT